MNTGPSSYRTNRVCYIWKDTPINLFGFIHGLHIPALSFHHVALGINIPSLIYLVLVFSHSFALTKSVPINNISLVRLRSATWLALWLVMCNFIKLTKDPSATWGHKEAQRPTGHVMVTSHYGHHYMIRKRDRKISYRLIAV